eukprot:COSAG05_NODE_8578_length_691_cov_1.059122_1_plen_191_part_01
MVGWARVAAAGRTAAAAYGVASRAARGRWRAMVGVKMLLCWLTSGLGVSFGLSTPTLFWSSTALPGETLLIAKSGDCAAPCEVQIAPAAATATANATATVVISPAQVNQASIMVTLPPTMAVGAYAVTAGGSEPLLVNAPDLWWVQGDAGNMSTTGGWLRVFGRSISLLPTAGDDAWRRMASKHTAEAIAA